MEIDVVIPVAFKDSLKLARCIEKLVAHSQTPIRHIYVVCQSQSLLENIQVDKPVVWVSEAAYPFSKQDIRTVLQERNNDPPGRGSWIYQQLLKLYAFRTIPDLRTNALVLDVDCFFTQTIEFLTPTGQAILAAGYPFKWLFNARAYPQPVEHPYIRFAQWLIPGWQPVSAYTGIHHHALLQQDIVTELFQIVEHTHQQPLWRAFASNPEGTPAEYAIYYHFALERYGDRVTTRHLKSCDFMYDSSATDFLLAEPEPDADFQAVGYHQTRFEAQVWVAQARHISGELKAAIQASGIPAFKLILDDGGLSLEAISPSERNRAYVHSPLRSNQPWQPHWLDETEDLEVVSGSKLVVFLDITSPACWQWLNMLKVVHRRADLPNVIGVLTGVTGAEKEAFAKGYALNFPVRTLHQKRYESLGIYSLPTACLLAEGIIQDKWVVRIPSAFIRRVRQGEMTYTLGPAQVF